MFTNQSAGLTALGDHTRLAIVACLAERPRAVGELADELPVSRPAVSQHLKVLKEAGLVTEQAVGTRRIYRLNPAGVGALCDQLEAFWIRALASYKDVVDKAEEDGHDTVNSRGGQHGDCRGRADRAGLRRIH